MKPRPPFIPHVPFDIVLAEPAFPPGTVSPDITWKSNPLFQFGAFPLRWKRLSTLHCSRGTRTSRHRTRNRSHFCFLHPAPGFPLQAAITNLVTKIQAVLDNLIVSPGGFDACQVITTNGHAVVGCG